MLGWASYDTTSPGAIERAHALYRPLLPRRLRRMGLPDFTAYLRHIAEWVVTNKAEPKPSSDLPAVVLAA